MLLNNKFLKKTILTNTEMIQIEKTFPLPLCYCKNNLPRVIKASSYSRKQDLYCNHLLFDNLQLSDHYKVLDIGLKYICIESKNTHYNSQK